jgi:hypothetical protein
MVETVQIPAWVVAAPRAITDCHWIAYSVAEEVGRASVHGEVCAILDWVTSNLPSETQARARLKATGPAAGTVAWLLGLTGVPPIELPRRNPDGTLLNHQQLMVEYMADKWDGPEERSAADQWARKQDARNQQLASLVPH